MKKGLVSLLGVMVVGMCCSSALASDLKLTFGYNCAPSKAYNAVLEATQMQIEESEYVYYLLDGAISATGGGGLVIGASLETEIIDNLSLKTSITADFMNKHVSYTGESTNNDHIIFNTYDGSSVPVYEEVSIDTKKWTLSGDALVKYAFNPISNLKVGVQGGMSLISTSIFDGLVLSFDEIKESIIRYIASQAPEEIPEDEIQAVINQKLPSEVYKAIDQGTGILKEVSNVSGGSAVIGAFVDYEINDKMNVAVDGYIGLLPFGNVVNPFKNCKLNATFSYSLIEQVNISAGFTFVNVNLSKPIHISELTILTEDMIYPDNVVPNDFDLNYTYRQLLPTLSVSYNF